ncbi:phosphoadenosine phosphosulfate reductase [Escherichia coli]|nr:phosphoadenosine phosphosulfate reductase [Escherichia coli]EFG1305225.1 phosphoadenosine phosphosulfate reductase [Escherichia coli]EFJ4552319.1 phosphoadenosine phosphosulfate reductase [Escherichia coli]
MSDTLLTEKILTGENVLRAAIARIEWIFETFPSVCLSFSGGKDSTVLFHLVAEVARRRKRHFSVLFIDWEAQYRCTIEHIQKMREMYHDVTETFYWVALPLTTVNGVSQFQPEWICWEPGVTWVRQPPEEAITDMTYFPFFRYAMTFEEFVPAFSSWFAGNRCGVAVLTGVRADESLNRFMGLVSQRKLRYADDKPWTTASPEGFYYTMYPLYAWKARDIWIYNARACAIYNPLYDLMYRADVPLRNMRVCEPFGPEQRKGLWLYHVLEPETWARMCERVSGAASGALYANESGAYFALRKRISKPAHHTWRSYAMFLLDVMPERTAEHYRNKIAVYLRWYQTRGFPDDIPDEQENDLGSRDIPSWRRICKTLIKNDFWYRTLSFSPNKPRHYERYLQRMKERRKEWGIL